MCGWEEDVGSGEGIGGSEGTRWLVTAYVLCVVVTSVSSLEEGANGPRPRAITTV